jgi:ketosteroid isomerase-like protein
MSRQNVEVVRRLHAAGMRLDVEAFVECCHPELEWEENTPFYPGLRSRYLGHEGAREWFTDALVEPWSEMRLERLEFLEADQDHAVVDFVLPPGPWESLRIPRSRAGSPLLKRIRRSAPVRIRT